MSDTRIFGTFKEQNAAYGDWSSVREFVNENVNAIYDMQKLVYYLKSAGIVCVTSGMNFTHAFTGEKFSGSYAILTAGRYPLCVFTRCKPDGRGV
ncbi:hypothetical protein HNQ91_003101 [Filimonas zeae]|nr:hypothetical protein [Filimonas zeae]MDR6340036.1 hypothetical protein [Filimonas zeae]